ncbi:hypothetical protein BKA56DRAFT_663406 [Ilyonectria sp. MPI-CAGE-AT-0026]|nr:hypothetical protein BKA56DRAFT_663406 [Ilyonectria sp. MPI-CAGE-AT-0026]
MNGALIISAYGANPDKEGVFWSLPLSHLRYYSPPVVTERRIASDTSRVSVSELWIVVLGVMTSQWNYACPDTETCFRLIILLSSLVNQSSTHIAWLKFLADAAKRYISTSDVDHSQHVKLLSLGTRWGRSFLNEPGRDPPPFFCLSHFPVLMSMISEIEEKISIMRNIARTLQASDQDLLIRYPEPNAARMIGASVAYHLASALPSSPTSSANHMLRLPLMAPKMAPLYGRQKKDPGDTARTPIPARGSSLHTLECVVLYRVQTLDHATLLYTPLHSFIAWRRKRDASRCARDMPLGRMADSTESEIVVSLDASGTQRPRRTRTLSTRAQENLEAQEKPLDKSSGTAKRAATNATRTTSRCNDDL